MTHGPANDAGRRERERSTRMANRPSPAINPRQPLRRRPEMIFDNQIVDDARGRARDLRKSGGHRPRFCSRRRSGDGACLKRRRCWFDSRREHLRPGSVFSTLSVSDRSRTVIAEIDPGHLGRDLGSGWSPKPASEVQSLGRPPAQQATNQPTFVQGGLGPAGPHKPGTRSVRFRPLQLELRPHAAISGSNDAGR